MLVTSTIKAQTVTIGTGTSTSYFLWSVLSKFCILKSFNYSRYAYLYTAAELGIPSGSIITQVEWNKSAGTRYQAVIHSIS